ncbi:MAG: hypothetical protein JST32_13385 [Bacteroidetes bacterium]|nr:hypothetical protein [Bacteroidota bacterium]
MLQNRVDPYGNIIKTPARGAWMGNRGILHDEHQHVVRPYKLKAWITCALQFRGRKRTVMAPNRYTELFFMDEATSFAAGHRPCFECRRVDYARFKSYWLKGNPEYGFDEKTSIRQIDAILHRERMNRDGSKVKYQAKRSELPDGSFVEVDEKPYLIAGGKLFEWSPFGYATNKPLAESESVIVLTPKSTVNAFRAGYLPQMAV